MQAIRSTASFLLFALALLASLSPAAASLPKIPTEQNSLPEALLERLGALSLASLQVDDSGQEAYESSLYGPHFSLQPQPLTRYGELFPRVLASPTRPLQGLHVASVELPSLPQTRVPGFSLFAPDSRPVPNRVSRGDTVGFGLGLGETRGGRDSSNLYAFVGWVPNMGTDPTGECFLQRTKFCEKVSGFLSHQLFGDSIEIGGAEGEIGQLTAAFTRKNRRLPQPGEVVARDDANQRILIDGRWHEMSGRVEAGSLEITVATIAIPAARIGLAARAAGATRAAAARSTLVAVGDEAIAEVTIVNPSALAKAGKNLLDLNVPRGGAPGPAQSVNAQAALRAKLSGLQKAQANAARVRELSDGRIRYYTKEVPASKSGPTRGASFVTEHNPQTGQVRQWMESYDQAGNVVRVHPKTIDGQVLDASHFPPTGSELQ